MFQPEPPCEPCTTDAHALCEAILWMADGVSWVCCCWEIFPPNEAGVIVMVSFRNARSGESD